MIRALGPLSIGIMAALSGCGAGNVGRSDAVAELSSAVQQVELSPAGFTDLDLELRPLSALEEGAEPSLFVHLLDTEQRVVRTFDQPLGEDWPVGGAIRVPVRLFLSALVEPPAPGDYSLTAGLFDPLIGRFAMKTQNRRVGKLEYEVARVRIGGTAPSPMRLEFLAGWAQENEVPDLELIRDRPLLPDRKGTVSLQPVAGPTEIWFRIEIPAAGLGDELRIRDGGDHARLRISSPCAPSFAEATGPGSHSISLLLAPPTTGPCTLLFAANHFVRSGTDGRLVAPTLQTVAWRSARP